MIARQAAVFLDRDGTIIRDTHYLCRPEDVELIPGAAVSIKRLNQAGLPVILVTNQSGIERGYYTADDFASVQTRVEDVLREGGAHLDAVYLCPHAPDAEGNRVCECRKPGTELFVRAITDHAIDAKLSWFVGDRWRDVQPAILLGGRGILVPTPETPPEETTLARANATITHTLERAVDIILGGLPCNPEHR